MTVTNNLFTGTEWNPAQVRDLYGLARNFKLHPRRYRKALSGRCVALVFEKPSLRARVTFEAGIAGLGGSSIFLDYTAHRLGELESIADAAINLESRAHCVVARVFAQKTLHELAGHLDFPVVNALSDKFHPCQALSDFFTLEEHFGDVHGLKFAYVGDGNNVCHSLISTAARLGAHIRVATPAQYAPDPAVVDEANAAAKQTGAAIEIHRSPEEAVNGAQAVYTDVWVSIGHEAETAERLAAFPGYRVNETLFSLAAPDAVFLHCLPARRGLEVTDGVIDSPRSLVFDQAENRLHVQKAILLTLLG
jgi:ornithine carbamoyltransferase